MNEDVKAKIVVVGGFALLMLLIIIPLMIFNKKQNNSKNFPTHDEIKITPSDVEDVKSDSYAKVKKQLENDYNFKKEALISNYNYKNYTSADLKQMVWNYIFAYEHNNTRFLSSMDEDEGRFCMRSRYVIDSFEELYAVKITENIEYLPYYFDYVTRKNNIYCFNFRTVQYDYNNNISILVDGITAKDGIVTTNLFLYEYYSSNTEREKYFITKLEAAIESSNYIEANKIVNDDLNGKVTHKQLNFKILNNGNFFKYQILSSKMLDY
jgi:hypothetical protein